MSEYFSPAAPVHISLEDTRVLVVDDNEDSRLVIRAFLDAAGVGNMDFAIDGAGCLEKLEVYKPDLVLLDLMMPGMDGFEVLRRMRGDPRYEWLPVIVETGLDSASNRAKAFAAGATDLICKPVNGTELIARVRTHLEKTLLRKELEASRASHREAVRVAQKLQESLLPPAGRLNTVAKVYGLEMDSYFEPSEAVGGDLWGLHLIDENRLGVYAVDFSGHGVGAAFNSFQFNAQLADSQMFREDPAAYLTRLNQLLHPVLQRGVFATMFYGVIDCDKNNITYAAAGITRPVLGGRNGEDLTFLDSSGVPLGILPDTHYENREASFDPGTFLFLYSDALLETSAEKETGNGMIGEQGVVGLLKDALALADDQPPLDAMMGAFFEMNQWQQLEDDLTAVWIFNPVKKKAVNDE